MPLRYAIAPALAFLAFGAQWLFEPDPTVSPFVLFYAAVALAASLGGRGPGLLAVAVSALLGNYFFVEALRFSLSGAALIATLLFALAGSMVAELCASLRSALLHEAQQASERSRMEAELRRREEKFHNLFDNAPIAMLRGRLDGSEVLDVNAAFLELVQATREEVVGRPSSVRWVNPAERPEMVRRLIAERRISNFECEALTTRGEVRHCLASLVLYPDQGVVEGSLLDITDREHAEAELRLLGEIAANVAEGVYLVGVKDLKILYANPTMERMFGYGPGELVGRHVSVINAAGGGDPVRTASRIEAALRDHDQYRGDVLTVKKDGTPFWSRTTISKMHHPQHGDVYVSLQADISEHKRAEEALREADHHKSEFLGVLSHELRNPLTPISTSAHLLEKSAALGERDRRAVASIERQVTHLTRLIDDLLDVTRIERGKIRLQRSTFDLAEVARRVVEDSGPAFESRELEVSLGDEPLWIDGDATRVAQIVANLISNAVKFTPAGGRIAVSLGRDDAGRAVLEVADTGIGIDADTLARLFKPFAQADRSLDRSRGGLGLGLALVKGLVEMHGGTVSAESRGPGEGARFTVKLPLALRELRAGGDERPPGEPQGRGKEILIIEDNLDAAESLGEVLALEGYQVALAHDGAEGVAKARELWPDAILCDIGLPGIDGYEVARTLRSDPAFASVLLVALTGYAQPEDQQKAREAGFNAHVSKPPDLSVLRRLLADALLPDEPAPAPPP